MGVEAEQVEKFPVHLHDADTGDPLSDARLVIGTEPETLVLETDQLGQVLIETDSELLKENPIVRIEPSDRAVLEANISGSLRGSPMKSVQLHSASDLEKLGDARSAVFYPPQDLRFARKVNAQLLRCREGIESILSLDPIRLSVILGPESDESHVMYLTATAPGYQVTWLCFRNEWDSGEFLRTIAHEWTESTLTTRLSLYDDPRNRFIGDGLAEFVAWKLYGITDEYGERLSPDQMDDQESIDLLSAFQVIPGKIFSRRKFDRGIAKHGYAPGYALAFAYWHELTEKHGATLPRRFVKKLSGKKSATNEEAIGFLVELTGDRAIESQLRAVNVEDARMRIAHLVENSK